MRVLQEAHKEVTLSESVTQQALLPLPVASQGCSMLQVANWQTPSRDIDVARYCPKKLLVVMEMW